MKDELFIRGKNPMTKMEVRGTIVSYLALDGAKNILEVGAGTGSVTVEIAKTAPNAKITAIEKTTTGCELIMQNAKKHGVQIEVIKDDAPTDLIMAESLFDRVYIGGTGRALKEIMSWLEEGKMTCGCIVVFSVITLESLNEIMTYITNHKRYTELEASQINASRLEMLGSYHYFKPMNPCTVIKCVFK